MKIRKALRKDVDDFIELMKENREFHGQFDPVYAEIDSNFIKDTKEFFFKSLKRRDEQIFFAEDKSKVVGLIWGNARGKGERKAGMIYELIVTKNYRRKGIGSKLIEQILAFFKERGCKRVKISVFQKNKAAKKAYDKMGFNTKLLVYMMDREI